MKLPAEWKARLAAEREKRSRRQTFDLAQLLYPKELEAARDPAREAAWAWGRRSGKTTTAEGLLTEVALGQPGTQSFYVSTSIKRAVATVWDELVLLNQDYGLSGKVRQDLHVITFPNRAKLWCTGVEDKVMANDLRGRKKVAFYFIDECQDWKDDLLSYFYESVVFPSLADVRGKVIFAGTGGPPRGFWYKKANDPALARYSLTPLDNPHLAAGEAQALIDKACRDRGVTVDDPSIQREFFARFVVDLTRQIFHYDPIRNGFTAELAPPPDDGLWKFAVGADVGTVDKTAVFVWGWHPSSPRLWQRRCVAKRGLGSRGQMTLIRETVQEFRQLGTVMGVVCDPGGGGAGLIIDLKDAFPGIGTGGMEAAEKTDKPAACVMMRDDLKNGTIAIDEADKEFHDLLAVPEWEPDAIGKVIRNHFPDEVDAALYSYRLARHHWFKPAAQLPEDPEELAALERRQRVKARMRENSTPWTAKVAKRRDPRSLLR